MNESGGSFIGCIIKNNTNQPISKPLKLAKQFLFTSSCLIQTLKMTNYLHTTRYSDIIPIHNPLTKVATESQV